MALLKGQCHEIFYLWFFVNEHLTVNSNKKPRVAAKKVQTKEPH
jgi:hypothetical protein